MTEMPVPPSIPITDLKVGTTVVRDELHFTGGLRALRIEGGWAIGPVLRDGRLQFSGTFGEENIAGVGRSAGALLFGADGLAAQIQFCPFEFGSPSWDRHCSSMPQATHGA